ncbi:MAG: DUF6798 domain-containing protein, partial [Gemmatimonadota bacterium]
SGWTTYVTFRVPHHVLPDVWSGSLWIAKLVVATALIAAVYRRITCPRLRFLAAYALASVGLFGAGLLIRAAGQTDLLRFYWFRFPDSILPFVSLMLIAFGMSRGFDALAARPGQRRSRAAEYALIALLVVLSASEIAAGLPGLRSEARWAQSSRAPMYDWIASNTPRDATFLVDPTQETFYVRAERSPFVTYKHAPQSESDVREWFARLTLVNGGETPRGSGLRAAQRIGAGLGRLSANQLGRFREEFGVDYYIGEPDRELPFRVVHRIGGLSLYELN